MKNLISFITLLFFLHTITNHLATTEAKTSAPLDPVVDIDGVELLIGNPYTIVPNSFPGSGINLKKRDNCRFSVHQQINSEGVTVHFGSDKLKIGDVVLESADLTIYSASGIAFEECNFFWQVDDNDEHFIFTDGPVWSPVGPRNRYFRIKKYELSGFYYSFVFCPESSDLESCKDVGIVYQDGLFLLALVSEKDPVFPFQFRKVNYSLKQV